MTEKAVQISNQDQPRLIGSNRGEIFDEHWHMTNMRMKENAESNKTFWANQRICFHEQREIRSLGGLIISWGMWMDLVLELLSLGL